ncbi:Uncharacterised protein [Serratia quinivorans]|nr:Uncharacterised protein [Serratia quinivorans]
MVAEFTFPAGLLYRVATESKLKNEQYTLYFDLSPKDQCKPGKAVTNQYVGEYNEDLASLPFMPMDFKINGGETHNDIATPAMEKNGYFFLAYHTLSVSHLMKGKNKGNLAVWIHPDADGRVEINKTYFSLNGFAAAYNKAEKLCRENL